MYVADIMTSAVVAVGPDLGAEAAWKEMRRAAVHHLVVIHEGRIAGVITDRDLGGRHGAASRLEKRVVDLMTPSVLVVAPEMSVRDAANLMRCNTINCLPVVDGKKLVGIVTTSDVLEMVGTTRT